MQTFIHLCTFFFARKMKLFQTIVLLFCSILFVYGSKRTRMGPAGRSSSSSFLPICSSFGCFRSERMLREIERFKHRLWVYQMLSWTISMQWWKCYRMGSWIMSTISQRSHFSIYTRSKIHVEKLFPNTVLWYVGSTDDDQYSELYTRISRSNISTTTKFKLSSIWNEIFR